MSLIPAALWAQVPLNVNSKYRIESVEISGGSKTEISRGLRADLESLVGQSFCQESLDRLARRLKRELNARVVSPKISKGIQPEQVSVLLEVKGREPVDRFNLSLPKSIYHSRQGWSGILEAKINAGDSIFSAGLVSDGDALPERFAGVRAGYQNTRVGTDHLRLKFQFASYHQQWDPRTLQTLAKSPEAPGVYRTRQEFAPELTVSLAEPLTVSTGVSFQRFQVQFPAAHTEAANAVTVNLRYARRLEDQESNPHQIEAGYNLRAATRTFESDFVYARHTLRAGYAYRWRRQKVDARFDAGLISGRAPLFERFSLGNAATLRGWDKLELNPAGATRMAHGSLGYQYRIFQIFYDTGSAWDKGSGAVVRHSIGIGFGSRDGFFLLLAFPIGDGRAAPMFMTGVAF
ncbi:MAG: BamA/TamA family outer membrane protein [Bryobacteraceae bacterium]